jgi:hypothetical protein
MCHHVQKNATPQDVNTHCLYLETLVSGSRLSRLRDLAVSVTVSGTSDSALQVSASASTNSSSALSLGGPVESSHLGIRVTARTATLVLDVVGSAVATIASGVVVLTTKTETGGTLGHLTKGTEKR